MYEKLLKDLKMVESIEDDYEMLRSIRKRLELDVQREVGFLLLSLTKLFSIKFN